MPQNVHVVTPGCRAPAQCMAVQTAPAETRNVAGMHLPGRGSTSMSTTRLAAAWQARVTRAGPRASS
eukprot:366245-Chlamydomonas_euryale.AAC.12